MKKYMIMAALLLACGLSANAQMIGATNSQGTYRPTGDSYGQRPTGGLVRIEGGTTNALALGYQLKSNLMVAAGVGYNVFEVMPLYVEMRLSQPSFNRAFYLDLKIGGDLFDDDLPFVGMMQVGMMFKHFGVGLGLGMAPDLEYSRGNFGLFNISLSYDIPL